MCHSWLPLSGPLGGAIPDRHSFDGWVVAFVFFPDHPADLFMSCSHECTRNRYKPHKCAINHGFEPRCAHEYQKPWKPCKYRVFAVFLCLQNCISCEVVCTFQAKYGCSRLKILFCSFIALTSFIIIIFVETQKSNKISKKF